jgi:subtilase family serine protease
MIRRILALIALSLVLVCGHAGVGQASSTPDLIVETITWSPTSPAVGDRITFTVVLRNQGTGLANQSHMAFYIDDALLASELVEAMNASASVVTSFTWTAQVGAHTVRAVADSNSEVVESSEVNNEKMHTFSTLTSDLTIEGITWTPENPSAGDQVDLHVRIKNQGTLPSHSSRVDFYIDGHSRGFQEVSRIDAGATATNTFPWIAQAGAHSLKAIVDKSDSIREGDETNNEKTVNYATFTPDLIIEDINWTPEEPSEGDNVTFTVNITNQGSGRAARSYIAYYIDDEHQDTVSLDAIEADASDNITFDWLAEPGSHTIKAIADYYERVFEIDDANNETTVTVTTLTPDLIVDDITWSPEEPSVGDNITFSVALKNQGSGKAILPRVTLYVDGFNEGYQEVDEIGVNATANQTFTWFAEPGSHTVRAVADKDRLIIESDEENNEKTVTYSDTALSDLVVETITWSPEAPLVGEQVTFTTRVKNQGNGAAGSFRVAYFVDGVELSSSATDNISANATANQTFTWTAEIGQHEIKASADYQYKITEVDEENNNLTIAFSPAVPDLVVEAITGSPDRPLPGDTVNFAVTLKNQGNGIAELSKVSFYVDDSYQGYQDVPEIAANATLIREFTWTARADTHEIKAVADYLDRVAESDETNNEKTVSFPIADLLMETITWQPVEPAIGDTVTFALTLTNQGTTPASPSQLSLLVDGVSQGALAIPEIEVGAAVTETFTWTAQAGGHVIVAMADSRREIIESDETNNEATEALLLVAPDLSIEALTWFPASPASGDTVTMTATIANDGTTLSGPSAVFFYLDSVYQGYAEVPEMQATARLAVDFSLTAAEGTNRIAAAIDKFRHVIESDELNNERTVIFESLPAPEPVPETTPAEPEAESGPVPAPQSTPAQTLTVKPAPENSSPIPSLGKGLWLDLLFVAVVIALISTFVRALRRTGSKA